MFNYIKLLNLAAAEDKAFLNARMDRLYFAMCLHDGRLLAPPAPEPQTRQSLNAALDAVTSADIRRHMIAPEPPDSIYEKMLEHKAKREAELAQSKTQPGPSQESVDDSEPEQGQ
jgi:hypothetical protein